MAFNFSNKVHSLDDEPRQELELSGKEFVSLLVLDDKFNLHIIEGDKTEKKEFKTISCKNLSEFANTQIITKLEQVMKTDKLPKICISESQITIEGITYFLNDKTKVNLVESYNMAGLKIVESFNTNSLSYLIFKVEEENRDRFVVFDDPSSRQISIVSREA